MISRLFFFKSLWQITKPEFLFNFSVLIDGIMSIDYMCFGCVIAIIGSVLFMSQS